MADEDKGDVCLRVDANTQEKRERENGRAGRILHPNLKYLPEGSRQRERGRDKGRERERESTREVISSRCSCGGGWA